MLLDEVIVCWMLMFCLQLPLLIFVLLVLHVMVIHYTYNYFLFIQSNKSSENDNIGK